MHKKYIQQFSPSATYSSNNVIGLSNAQHFFDGNILPGVWFTELYATHISRDINFNSMNFFIYRNVRASGRAAVTWAK